MQKYVKNNEGEGMDSPIDNESHNSYEDKMPSTDVEIS